MGFSAARRQTRRTIASASPELQTLFKVMAAFGSENWRLAQTLIDVDFRFETAAVILRMKPATMRQRVHRIQKRIREMLGGAFEMPKRVRASVHFGADDSGVYRMAAASSEGEGGEE